MGSGIAVDLNKQNTTINPSSVTYNVEATVDLSGLQEYLQGNKDNNRIFVETNLEIPVLISNEAMVSSITLINYYNISEIINNTVIQYGYYEGNYDDTREIKATTQFFVYSIGRLQ